MRAARGARGEICGLGVRGRSALAGIERDQVPVPPRSTYANGPGALTVRATSSDQPGATLTATGDGVALGIRCSDRVAVRLGRPDTEIGVRGRGDGRQRRASR